MHALVELVDLVALVVTVAIVSAVALLCLQEVLQVQKQSEYSSRTRVVEARVVLGAGAIVVHRSKRPSCHSSMTPRYSSIPALRRTALRPLHRPALCLFLQHSDYTHSLCIHRNLLHGAHVLLQRLPKGFSITTSVDFAFSFVLLGLPSHAGLRGAKAKDGRVLRGEDGVRILPGGDPVSEVILLVRHFSVERLNASP
jgi:hypothetical protein